MKQHTIVNSSQDEIIVCQDKRLYEFLSKLYLIEPLRHVQRVIKISGVSFTLQDLRRTFITIAESIDTSAYALKRLVNHKMTNDVTAGYIVSDVERLRKPMEQISKRILQYFGVDEEKNTAII